MGSQSKEYYAEYYKKNKETILARNRAYYQKTREKRLFVKKCWREDNKENRRGKRRAEAAKRKAAKLQRTPAWNDDLVMRMIYEDCPEGHQVDHIIPLQGEKVSGLHVHYNLQWLTATENASKGNKFDV